MHSKLVTHGSKAWTGRTLVVLAEQTLACEHRRIDLDDGSNLQIRLSGLIYGSAASRIQIRGSAPTNATTCLAWVQLWTTSVTWASGLWRSGTP